MEYQEQLSTSSVLRGQKAIGHYRVFNPSRNAMQIRRTQTGCGCAVLVTQGGSLDNCVVPPESHLDLTLEVSSAGRAGQVLLPFALELHDSYDQSREISAAFSMFVNPGWAVTKECLTINAQGREGYEVVTDQVVLYRTSAAHPFTVERITSSDPAISVEVLEPVLETKTEMKLSFADDETTSPACILRVSAVARNITESRRATLVCELSHGLERPTLEIVVLSPRPPLSCAPKSIVVDARQHKIKKQIVVSSVEPSPDLVFLFPKGVGMISEDESLSEHRLVVIDISPGELDGQPIVIRDGKGNSIAVAIATID